MGSLVWLEVAFEFKLKSTTIVFKGRASSIPSILLLMLCYIFVEWKSLINEWLLNMIKGPRDRFKLILVLRSIVALEEKPN